MAAAMRFKSFVEAVNAADEQGVKGQTQVIVRTESEEEVVAEVLVDADGTLLIMTKGAMSDIVTKAARKPKVKEDALV